MHILIGLAAAVALLWFWLTGHWFGRVLAFLAFGAAFGVCGALLTSAGATYPNAGVPGMVIGVLLAWPIASIPIYIQRQQQTATLRRGYEMLHPDWTPEQITSRVKMIGHNQGGSR